MNINNQNSHLHPMDIAINSISKIFSDIGFDTVYGPELEDEWHNFDALNVPRDHSARDMQDTFWIKNKSKIMSPDFTEAGFLLRTHTSNLQIRTMLDIVKQSKERLAKGESLSSIEEDLFPIAICCPGKVFRNESTDATHEAQFFQVEGLYVAKDANLSELIGVLENMFSKFFGKELKARLRSSFFPFVEPGNEFDIQCVKCEGKGCNVCKGTGWIEIGGAGMIHPNVLKSVGIDHNIYKGWAFGCGIDRMIMLKYGIDDIRLLYNGDLRLVKQF